MPSRRRYQSLVFSNAEKTSKCLEMMRKACYARIATEELEGSGCIKVDGESLEDMQKHTFQGQTDGVFGT